MYNSYLKRVLYIALILIMISHAQAQNWIKYYPINSASGLMWGVESYDKGYYFAGMTTQAPYEIKLYKTDVNGNTLWTRTIEKSKNIVTLGGITPTNDGGIALEGAIYRSDSTNDDFLVKFNSCGDMEWSKIYDVNVWGIGGPIKELQNGNFVICADVTINNWKNTKQNKDSIGNYYNSWLFETDNLGNLKWQKFANLYWHSLYVDRNENLLVSGYVYRPDLDNPDGNSFIRSSILKTSASGYQKWQTVFGVKNNILTQGASTCQLSDNEYYTLMAKNLLINQNVIDALYITKYDSSGNNKWSMLVGDSTFENNPLDIISMNDSTLLILSEDGPNILNDFYSADLHLFKINKNGKIIKEFKYLNTGMPMSFYKLLRTRDNKYIVAGMYAENSIIALKLDDNLDLDTFYSNDTNKYDFLCGHNIVTNATINLSTDTVYITIPFPSADTLYKPGSFLVYPNPSNGLVHVRCLAGNENVSLTIYDVIGRLIHTYTFVPGDTGHADIDLGSVAPGCYIMELLQDGKRYVQKEIVE